MPHKVGPKGQVVIAKEVRKRFGIKPGWEALQVPAEDHVKIYFLPPPSNRSLAGVLGPYVTKTLPPGQAWDQAREEGWLAAAREKEAWLRDRGP